MSLDACYIFVYNVLPYAGKTPMEIDISYLRDKYGGYFSFVDGTTVYWGKPKYTLLRDEFKNLMADQILERKECELWEIIK